MRYGGENIVRARLERAKGQWPEESRWAVYVASCPLWRDIEACGGVCQLPGVCGRARMCVRDARTHAQCAYALARLAAHVGVRAPRA